MNENILYEDEMIKVVDNGINYEFIAYVENKTDKDIIILFDKDNEYYDSIKISANRFIGFLGDEEDLYYIKTFKNGQFYCEYADE